MLYFHLLILEREWKGKRKKETSICCSAYLCIHCLLLLCALTRDRTHNLGIWGWRSNQVSCPARAHCTFLTLYDADLLFPSRKMERKKCHHLFHQLLLSVSYVLVNPLKWLLVNICLVRCVFPRKSKPRLYEIKVNIIGLSCKLLKMAFILCFSGRQYQHKFDMKYSKLNKNIYTFISVLKKYLQTRFLLLAKTIWKGGDSFRTLDND